MAVFSNGHEKLGGRKPGTPNKGTQSIRALLDDELSQGELRKLWHKYLFNKNLAIAFEAFKLANQYLFGRPASEPINEEDAPRHMGPQFDLSQIVTRHVPHVPVTEE
jgi:hypothetical protein